MSRNRRIAHLDMDAFFASVELLRYPQLKGHPLVVGGDHTYTPTQNQHGGHTFARLRNYVGRGVVATSTYEARAFGVFSGMGLMKAARLAPDAFLLPADFDAYEYYSQLFKSAVINIAPLIEDVGIDEIYIDLTEHTHCSADVAREIKQAITDATGLTCSIGITPNKLLSKICSDLDKPNGVTILMSGDIKSKIWPLPIRKINGIGPKSETRLMELGIHTIGDLAVIDPAVLIEHFGESYGEWLHYAANGVDDSPLITHWEPKSTGRETTFERDLHPKRDKAELSAILLQLCMRVSDDLKSRGYVGKTIGIKLRYDDFSTMTRDHTWPNYTDDPFAIRHGARLCLRRVPLVKKLRLLGVRVGGLIPYDQIDNQPCGLQLSLPLEARDT